MKIHEVLVWLMIFIVGSLIVNFIIYPSSFTSVTDSVGSTFKGFFKSGVDTTKLIPSEMEEYGSFKRLQRSCSLIQTLGDSEGVPSIKKNVCQEACGKRSMDYYSYDCEKDLLVCYCK